MSTTDSKPDSDGAKPLGLGCNEGLGPLPEAGKVFSEPPAFYKDDWKHHKFYTAAQMRAYAIQEVAAERERCARIAEQSTHGPSEAVCRMIARDIRSS